MKSDGKYLEDLVAFIEQLHLPEGFKVEKRKRIFNEAGVQMSELDIEIRGPVGSTEFSWLIECRDRPSEGSAGGEWIEQLVGRRDRYCFGRVSAVSTSGFSSSAIEYAKTKGIELKSVNVLDVSEFADWLLCSTMTCTTRLHAVKHMTLYPLESATEAERSALSERIKQAAPENTILKSSKTGLLCKNGEAFVNVVDESLFDGLIPGGPSRPVQYLVDYVNDDDHFVVSTDAGDIRIGRILFVGELSVSQRMLSLANAREYGSAVSGDIISQTAESEPILVGDTKVVFGFHHIAKNGTTVLSIRRIDEK